MSTPDVRDISLRTQLEMARGGLGRATNPEEADVYVTRQRIMQLGEEILRRLAGRGVGAVFVHFDGGSIVESREVCVDILNNQGRITKLKEGWENFPSPTLRAQVLLLG